MSIKYKVVEVDHDAGTLVVEYSLGTRVQTLNIGYPDDDSDLETYISSRAPEAALKERFHSRSREDVLKLRGTVKKAKATAEPSPFTLSSM